LKGGKPFHSFARFDIPTRDQATFSATTPEAGSVTVGSGEQLTIDGAEITTKAIRADAGDVTVTGRPSCIS
jgi:hypothetical protein